VRFQDFDEGMMRYAAQDALDLVDLALFSAATGYWSVNATVPDQLIDLLECSQAGPAIIVANVARSTTDVQFEAAKPVLYVDTIPKEKLLHMYRC
jgi:hypothetical protein